VISRTTGPYRDCSSPTLLVVGKHSAIAEWSCGTHASGNPRLVEKWIVEVARFSG
jgi:hypothetical protein